MAFAFLSSAASVDGRRRLLAISPILAGQMFVGQSLPGDLGERQHEASVIVHVFPIVVAERLLVQIPEQVEGFHGNVGAVQPALEQRPEVLQAVGVDLAVHIPHGVVNHLMLELIQPFVGFLFRASVKSADPVSTCLRTSACSAFFLRFGTTEVRTSPPRSRIPMTAVLSFGPVPLILAARLAACMLRALPPMKVSSASTSPQSIPSPPFLSANRRR